MALSDLQRALDESRARASTLTRSFLQDDQDAREVQDYVNRILNATVATVAPKGEPHAVLVLAACLDGVFHFTASFGTLLLRNLEREPSVALVVTDNETGVIARGRARRVARSTENPALMASLHEAAARGHFTPADWDGYIYAIDPSTVFAA